MSVDGCRASRRGSDPAPNQPLLSFIVPAARFGLIEEWHVVIRKLLADFNLRRFSWDSVTKIA
jgi:hypothetical protein